MNNIILFVSHHKSQCGVYEFGVNITDVLRHSRHYQFVRAECSSFAELQAAIAENKPACIIYNYYPSVLPWIASKIGPRLWKSNIASIPIPQIGILHEITQHVADMSTNYRKKFLAGGTTHLCNSLFDYYIAPDPTLLLLNPLVYKTGRLVPSYQQYTSTPSKPVIGSFGFGTSNKGFEKIVQLVGREYDEAVIRFNIPSADYGGDKDGVIARGIAENCRAQISKPGIQLVVTHEFMDKKALLDFLSHNSINVFLYEDKSNRGLSSAIDDALSVQRPIAISDAVMFRHLFDVEPSICVTKNSLYTILQNGFAPLQKHYQEWTAENLLWEYERILDSIFRRRGNVSRTKGIIRTLRSKVKRVLSLPDKSFTWLRSSEKATEDDMQVSRSAQYQPIQIPAGVSFNRILDNNARRLYAPAIALLTELVPKTISKKIAEANVQQAFVFDTIYRHLPHYPNPRLLCVGCYQDTASMSLIKMGYKVEEIDPMINYYLQEYCTKPTTLKNSYDVIFSTSVIEHDPDDESFVTCIADLLAPGGVAVITCDYKDGWKPGEPKPECNWRFYTQRDLKDRLLPLMVNCRLVDEPQWESPAPDFNYLGKYQYTFAAIVARKHLKQE